MAEEQPDNIVVSLLRAIRADIDEIKETLRVNRHQLVRIEDRFDSVDETLLQMLRDNRDFGKRLRVLEAKE